MKKPDTEIWQKDTSWIQEADAVIAEVTNPSLGVGYEIAYAESLSKPVLALFRETEDRKLSAMIAGSPEVTVGNYADIESAQHIIRDFINNL